MWNVVRAIGSGVGLTVRVLVMWPGTVYKRHRAAGVMRNELIASGIPRKAAAEMAHEYQGTLSAGNVLRTVRKQAASRN